MQENTIQQKKPNYSINDRLMSYLERYKRTAKINIQYEDLKRFYGYINLEDSEGNDTLWLRVYYPEYEYAEIEASLTRIYTLLHSDGDEQTLPFLTVDSIDFCSFGNSQPFRIRVRNILNDNYTNFYIKKADASRVYGLELEELLSPYSMNYLVYKDTLIEEHIMGIPGDVFIKEHLPSCSDLEKSQISKEFVKFNERCIIGLLGDMRSYNYVIIPTHDFDQVNYRIRPIDFDQQTFEGNIKMYIPQFYKENFKMVQMVIDKLQDKSIEQYRKEIRSVLARRLLSNRKRFYDLLRVMHKDSISTPEHIDRLRTDLYKRTKEDKFKSCSNMAEILYLTTSILVEKHKSVL